MENLWVSELHEVCGFQYNGHTLGKLYEICVLQQNLTLNNGDTFKFNLKLSILTNCKSV